MGNLWRDIRFSLRMMRKNLRFVGAVVFILALGIGANSTIFSVVRAVLLRPLGYSDSDRLVMLWETNARKGLENAPVSYPDYQDFKQQVQSFEAAAAFKSEELTLTGGDEPLRVDGASVSDGFFHLLGVPALHGRTFSPEEYKPGSNVAIISNALWQRRFGARPSVVGESLTLNEKSYSVVGVMPEEFRFPGEMFGKCDVWIPLAPTAAEIGDRNSHTFFAVARLKPGATLESARAEVDAIGRRIMQQGQAASAGWGAKITPLREQFVGDVKTPLLILFTAVSFVLLIACINVANLLLGRAGARQKEIAVRMAIGASRWRLVQQLLTESLLLSLAGAALGLLLARWGVELLKRIIPASYVYVENVGIDGKVLGFTALIAALTAVLFGLAPALQSTRLDVNHWLKEEGGKSSPGPRRRYLSRLLIIFEVSLSLVLIIGATLLIKSFIRLQRVEPGFDPHNLLALNVSLPETKYAEAQRKRAFFQQVVQQLRATPGVSSVGGVNNLPLSGSDKIRAFLVEGREPPAPGEAPPTASYSMVLGDYFTALRIPLIKGRYFNDQDTERAPLVAILNETLARRLFPNEDPIGKRLILKTSEPKIIREVVGVVGDIKAYGLELEPNPGLFVPYAQDPFASMSLVLRSTGDPLSLAGAAREAAHAADPYQPVDNFTTMDEMVSKSVAQQRLSMVLLSTFAAVALILAAVGIYSVVSHSVHERTREIGIRVALGAAPSRIVRMIAVQSMSLTFIGLAAGLLVALFLTRFISSMLFGVEAIDPVVFVGAPLLLALIALTAAYLPARRASKVDPMIALRDA